MKRREEIVAATLGCRQNHADLKRPITPDDVADAFEKGAYWADATMIDKACEWLKKWTYQDCLGVSPIARLKVGFSSVKELIEDFKRAMEE